MAIFDQLNEMITPHAHKLNETLNLQGALLHTRLGAIEQHLSDLGRPDVGDLWADVGTNKNLLAKTPAELITVQMNEILEVQAITVACLPAVKRVTIRSNGRLRATLPVLEASPCFLTPGADIVFLPGEVVTIEAEAEGVVEATITCVRRGIPIRPQAAISVSGERMLPQNTHDLARDVILSRTGGYTEIPGDINNPDGRPPMVHPGVSPVDN